MKQVLFLLIILHVQSIVGQSFQLDSDDSGPTGLTITNIDVENYSEENVQNELLVYVVGSDIPMSGTYLKTSNSVVFRPDYPFEAGINYHVSYFRQDTSFQYAKSLNQEARVTAIYPSTTFIPENLLRFYIYFSSPMRDGEFLEHIHLYNEAGEDMKDVFFDNQYELWNEDYTRLTILVDPGRVKTGLKANIEKGRAFQCGQTYTLSVDENWKTISGQTLSTSFDKAFTGVSADTIAPSVLDWKISTPLSSSFHPLTINFKESVDHICASKYIKILSPEGSEISGTIELNDLQTALIFHPDEPWTNEEYTIIVNGRLEDIVGNNLNGLFDHHAGDLNSLQEGETYRLTFNPATK
jgi:hypothetical protein